MKNASDENLCNSDGAIDQNFDVKTHENDDYSDQELFVDEDEGDDNESSDETRPPKISRKCHKMRFIGPPSSEK